MKHNNSFSFIAIVFSSLSLLVSSYIICAENRFNADWYAVVIGVLSLLVTVLIGWNIYTVIDFDRRVDKKVNEVRNILSEEVDLSVYNAAYQLTINIFGFNGEVLFDLKEYNRSAVYYAKALKYADRPNNNEKESSVLLDKLVLCIEKCSRMSLDEQNEIIENIRMVKDIRVIYLIDKIRLLS